jgi:hypothetical protein
MIHRSTANALNKRANKAVPVIGRWFDYFRVELRKQVPLERSAAASKYVDEQYPEFVEIRRKDIERLVDDLREIRRELAEYTDPM